MCLMCLFVAILLLCFFVALFGRAACLGDEVFDITELAW